MAERFTFFYHGPFSQFYPAGFTVEGIMYNCAEQYMMYKKALLFGDISTAGKILKETNPAKMKKLGRKIKNFDKLRWEAVAREIVYIGNRCKFSDNKDLYDKLIATKGTTLVEASPYDKIWGIGLIKTDPRALDRCTWLGTNWLGEILTQLRNNMMEIHHR